MTKSHTVFAAVAALSLCCAAASGATLSFGGVSKNNDDDTASGEQQLTVDVFSPTSGGETRGTPNLVSFLFTNSGSVQSTITNIFFDDGTLLGISQINNGEGVNFERGSKPGDLPGGEDLDPPFEATVDFNISSSTPQLIANGIDPGESLEIVFELINDKTFDDTIQALITGELRIGLHVRNFPDGGSESFVNLPPQIIPLPSAAGLAMAGLVALGARRRRSAAV